MKDLLRKTILVLCCGASLLLFVSCDNEGTAEKAGENIDEAVEDAKQGLEKAGDSVGETVEESGEQLQEAAEELQNQ